MFPLADEIVHIAELSLARASARVEKIGMNKANQFGFS